MANHKKGVKNMKNSKKFLLIFIPLFVSSYALGMEKSLEERIKNLEDKVALLEKSSEAPTYEKCSPDGKNCKRITQKKASTIIRKKGKRHRIRRCRGSRCDWLAGHGNVQQKFQELQKKYGIKPLTSQEFAAVQGGKQQPGVTQAQFNKLRSQINELLSSKTATEEEINKKIDEFARLNPARRPSPEDYREVLKAKIEAEREEVE